MSELKLQQCRVDNRYDVVDCLGRGSYAEIYVALDLHARPGAPQHVVIKALNFYLQGTPDEELERTLIENFQNEAIALDRVRHPHIIGRLGHGTARDLAGKVFHYLVLEYMPGGDLLAQCRQQPFSFERALYYVEQICAGLDHAHSRGVIHRDIKPQNLLLSADLRTVKIADFGVAKLEASDGEVITRVGTDVYAAPEHHPLVPTGPLDAAQPAHPKMYLTPAADVYSLAKTAYMMLTGESPRRFAQKQITYLPPATTEYAWAPRALEVLHAATDARAEKRFRSAREFFENLRDAALEPTLPLEQRAAAADAVTLTANPRRHADAARAADTVSVDAINYAAPPTTTVAAATPEFPPIEPARGAEARARIVVPLFENGGAAKIETNNSRPFVETNGRGAMNANAADGRRNSAAHLRPSARRARRRQLLTPLILIFLFSGGLLATHKFFSRRPAGGFSSDGGNAGGATATLNGREAVAKTDINLRPDPSRNNAPVGKVEWKSRVRILNTSGSWVEVEIIARGRENRDPTARTRGWINQAFLSVE